MIESNESKSISLDKSIVNNKINDGRENDDKLFAFAGPKQIVYEGSTVLLEGQSFSDNKKLVWKQIDGPSVVLEYENKETINTKLKNPCFRAPFISLNMNDVNTIEDNNKIDNSKLKPYT